jgi:hypothetical protein
MRLADLSDVFRHGGEGTFAGFVSKLELNECIIR